jgi:hypothetical protein
LTLFRTHHPPNKIIKGREKEEKDDASFSVHHLTTTADERTVKVVDGFRERVKGVEAVTNELLLELFQVGLRGIEDTRANGCQVADGTSEGSLGTANKARNLACEVIPDIGEASTTNSTEGTEDSAQTLVEKVLTDTSEGTGDTVEEAAQDLTDLEISTSSYSTNEALETTEEFAKDATELLADRGLDLSKDRVEIEIQAESTADRTDKGTDLSKSLLGKSEDLLLDGTKKRLKDNLTLLDELTKELVAGIRSHRASDAGEEDDCKSSLHCLSI